MTTLGLRRNVLREDNAARDKVSFVELFFDLVFVFAITEVSHFVVHAIEEGHPVEGFLRGGIMLLAIWWVWVYTTWVTNWLDPETGPVRWMLIVLMFLGLLMSTSIGEAFGDRALLFAGAYVLMQIGRTIFAMLAMGRHYPIGALNMLRIGVWFAVPAIAWISGALVEDPSQRTILWLIALALEYSGPSVRYWVPGIGSSPMSTWRVSGAHIAERAGLFIIITLGESLLVTGAAFASAPITVAAVAAFTAAFVGSILLWLVYFNHGEESGSEYIRHADDNGSIARFSYTYLHAIVVMGVVLIAVADALVLAHPEGHAEPLVAGLVYGAPAVYLLGNLLFKRSIGSPWLRSHLLGLALLGLLGVGAQSVLSSVSPLGHTWIANAVLAAVLVFEEIGHRRQRAEIGSAHIEG